MASPQGPGRCNGDRLTETLARFFHPQSVTSLGTVMAASATGFIGNGAVAFFRIKAGRRIGSLALVADGCHARVDSWTSLAVLIGAVGVWPGQPLADSLAGWLITAAVVWLSGTQGKPSSSAWSMA